MKLIIIKVNAFVKTVPIVKYVNAEHIVTFNDSASADEPLAKSIIFLSDDSALVVKETAEEIVNLLK